MPTQQRSASKGQGRGPVHTVRHRNLKAAIWRNETAKGAMYNVTITRSYREEEYWRDSHSFGYDDLMNLSALLYEAHAFISATRAAESADRLPARRTERSGSRDSA